MELVLCNGVISESDLNYCTIQTNQPTRCNSFTDLLLDVYMCCWSWSVDHDQQCSNRHSPTVKPEAPSAV